MAEWPKQPLSVKLKAQNSNLKSQNDNLKSQMSKLKSQIQNSNLKSIFLLFLDLLDLTFDIWI